MKNEAVLKHSLPHRKNMLHKIASKHLQKYLTLGFKKSMARNIKDSTSQ